MGVYFLTPEYQKKQSETFGNSTQTTPYYAVGPGSNDLDFYMSNYSLGKLLIELIK